jgi:D-hydroxyproline dehydrogenase subunit alpha
MSTEQVIIVGGGVAGCSAALEAARHGLSVMLVDEHPQTPASMSFDAPYFYGSRLAAVLSDASAVADRVLGANELLLECLEAGVNVLTNTCVWANYVPGPNSCSTDERRLGLADAERSWLVAYDQLIIAPGARDLVLSFPGWHLPGVLGAAGASALVHRYQALGGSRAVVLGSGNTGLRLAKQMLDAGVHVAAIVDVAPAVRGDAALRSVLESAGVPFLTSHVIEAALGDREVTGVQLRKVDAAMQPVGDSPVAMACDTVCMAFGLVPNVELAAQTGCALDYQVSRGGWVPALDDELRTSLPFIYVVGDGAGVTEAMLLDSAIAADQGQRAARALASVKGIDVPPIDRVVGARDTARAESPAQEWLRALVAVGGLDVVVCQCEEVTRRDILELRPPRYVPGAAGARAVQLSATARASQDVVKRLTRVGMGHCQGKRCRDQTALLLADPRVSSTAPVVPGSYRPPLRSLPLNVIADHDETEEMRRSWPTWFHPVNEGEIG